MMTKIICVLSLASIIFTIESNAARAMPEEDRVQSCAPSHDTSDEIDFDVREIDLPRLLACTPAQQSITLGEIAFQHGVYNPAFASSHLFQTLRMELDAMLAHPLPNPLLPTFSWELSNFFTRIANIDLANYQQFIEAAYYYRITGWSKHALNTGFNFITTSLIPNPFCAYCPPWISSFALLPPRPMAIAARRLSA